MWGPPAIPPDRMTIASLAKQNGYRTACIGKWHLGWDWPIPKGKRNLMPGSKEMKALLETLITEGRSTPGPTQPNDIKVARYPK